MTLSDLAIRRPVFAWMLMIGLILFGAISFQRLGISQLPDVDFPVLSVNISWEGAAPEVIESELVDRLEQAVITVEGIKEISSSIRQGRATISVEFDISRDVDSALQEIQSAISEVRLPFGVDPPTIKKSNPEDQPILWLGISSPKRSLAELSNFVDLVLKDQFQVLSGVGEVVLGGFTARNLRIWIDPAKLAKYELSVLDVRDALQRGHLETAAGIIENPSQEINLRVMGEGATPEQVSQIILGTRGGRSIYGNTLRIADVARVEDGLDDVRRLSRVNGIPGVGIGIKKQRGSNAVAVGDLVKQKMQEVAKTLPEDMSIGVNFDSTVFVRESVEETEFTLLLSAIITGFVCWLFLGSLRPTINILLSIPTSIVGTFTIIYFMGFTLNLFTILGLSLAVGIVVDDAIMVLENIYRHKAMGKNRVQASADGAREITFAAIAATIAVIAIFIPVIFMDGAIGKFFFQFGVTITAAVALSLLEAITLTPMRCSQIMSEKEFSGWFPQLLDRMFARVGALYAVILSAALRWRWLVVALSLGIFGFSLTLGAKLRKEFIPPQDQSMFIARVETPVGSSLTYTSEALRAVEAKLIARPDIRRVYAAVGGFGGGDVNTAMLFISLVPVSDRVKSQGEIMQEVRNELKGIPNLKAFIQDLSTRGFTAQRGFPVDVNLRGAEWSVLEEKSAEILKRLEATGLVVDTNTDYRLGQPEVRVIPDRNAAAQRGVSIDAITQTVSAAIGGVREGKFTKDGRRYDVRLRLDESARGAPSDILSLAVRNAYGELVPLKDVAKVESGTTLQTITRKNRERSISVYANVAPGRSQAEALSEAERISREILPPGYQVYLGGGAKTFSDSFKNLYLVLWLGVIVAYMVLASQFDSFLDPITVLLALPFSLTGALAALYIGGHSINLYSMIGLILLMGIAKKNSILLVEFINHKRFIDRLPLSQAILKASPIRLRPILMTSASTLAAALPAALALGPGAESRIPMAVTILGGVAVSTLFTLVVVPCVYSLLAPLENRTRVDFTT